MSARATETPEHPETPGGPGSPAGRLPGLTLVSHDGRPYRFDPGALCLELLVTGGPGAFARYEVLHEPADLVAWAVRSRLPEGLEPTVSDAELGRVRTVRDALFLLTADRAHGRPQQPEHLDALNAAAAEAPLVPRLAPDGTRAWAPGATGTQLLSTVARDAIDLFTGPYAHRVRECGAHDCRLLFVDTSRPGRRRWCAMEHCGNREKVRAHRARGRLE
ncbi:CGNR zinc finger domain-containing protein [Streptomyces sp. NPDC048737]|uniref:CGNR zinc finger domain-containing protein n=1 Tax=unclassified Streptomyces TaxID=2593676 RepID=UPI00341A1263